MPPGGRLVKRVVSVRRREGVRSQWKTALLKRRSIFSSTSPLPGEKVDRSAWRKGTSGRVARALASMSALESTPVMRAPGNAESKADVLFPGPQPRS